MAEQQTSAHVAETATTQASLPKQGIILLGTFGAQATPTALVKLPDGETTNVTPGDRLDGRRVLAIETGRLALERNGTATWIEIPG